MTEQYGDNRDYALVASTQGRLISHAGQHTPADPKLVTSTMYPHQRASLSRDARSRGHHALARLHARIRMFPKAAGVCRPPGQQRSNRRGRRMEQRPEPAFVDTRRLHSRQPCASMAAAGVGVTGSAVAGSAGRRRTETDRPAASTHSAAAPYQAAS
jgi:hypothetical protein